MKGLGDQYKLNRRFMDILGINDQECFDGLGTFDMHSILHYIDNDEYSNMSLYWQCKINF